jgi:hypothetical protein
MNKNLIASLLAATLTAGVVQAAEVKQAPLSQLLKETTQAKQVEFSLPPALANDLLPASQSGDLNALLQGYSYVAVHGANGRLERVLISGRNGDGHAAGAAGPAAPQGELLAFEPAPAQLPQKYAGFNPGSVFAISLPVAQLKSMKKGERMQLSLPDGQFSVLHDNRFEHENGDITWVGKLEGQGDDYRVIVTMGQAGTIGRIVTPNSVYGVELESGANWLVDVNAAGLSHGEAEDDGLEGAALSAGAAPKHAKAPSKTKSTRTTTTTSSTTTTTTTSTTSDTSTGTAPAFTGPTVDLMILYTQGMNAKTGLQTRLNNIVALANQAYIDSNVNMRIRLVGTQLISNYTDANANKTALNDLTNAQGAFANVPALRQQFGADLVALIRPFDYANQTNCGQAWINGAMGGAMDANLGYSVISDGTDPVSRSYCTDYTLAHETGHNLGSAHDRAHAAFPGKFNYSYGYGAAGTFGTIMSYYNPIVGKFSNPTLSCSGQVCGSPENAADAAYNALSITNIAAEVANFMAATVQ